MKPFAAFIGGCALFLFFYLTFSFSSSSLPGLFGDSFIFLWNFWWLKNASLKGYPIYYTNYLYYPEGASLCLHTLAEGITLPLALFLTPLTGYQAGTALSFSLNFAFTALFLMSFLQNTPFALLLSLLFTGAPYFFSHLAGGHLNLLSFFPLPLLALSILKTYRSKSLPLSLTWCVFASLSLLLCGFISLNYLYFSVCALALLAPLGIKLSKGKSALLFAALTAGGCVLWSLKISCAFNEIGKVAGFHKPSAFSLNTKNLLVPSVVQLIGMIFYPSNRPLKEEILQSVERSAYLGVGVCLLAVYAFLLLSRSKKIAFPSCFLLTALLFYLLSFGPSLIFYRTLKALLHPAPPVPSRFSIMGFFFLITFIAIMHRGKQISRWSWLFLCISLLEFIPSGIFSQPYPKFEELKRIAIYKRNAVLDLSGPAHYQMLHQLWHRKAIIGGWLSRRPKHTIKKIKRNPFLRFLRKAKMRISENNQIKIKEGFIQLGSPLLLVSSNQLKVRAKVKETALFFEKPLSKDYLLYVPLDR